MKGYIYKIYDNTNGNVYYGSTIQNVSQRVSEHRRNYKRYLYGSGNNCKSYDIIANEDYDYTIEEVVEYEKMYEFYNRERWYIENNDCINKYIPNRTHKEYYEQNREQLCDKIKDYREKNKEQIKEYQKEYRENKKVQIKEYQKEYRENKKEQKKENNKERIPKNI